MPACIHRHVNTNTSTSPVFVLEFMGHLIYIDTRAWVWIRDVQNGDGLCFQRDAKRRILFAEEDSLSIEANVVLSFRPPPPREGDWKGEGREGVKKNKKLPFSCPFPPNPPCSFQEWPLCRSTGTQEETPGRGDPRETLISSFNTMIVLTLFKL